MSPHTRFADRAEQYARYRPDYPAAAIDAVLDGCGRVDQMRIADVGAGTGISSRMLSERGAAVIAVEPNFSMIRVAGRNPRIRFIAAGAEATALRSSSVDLVCSFQAFHWFDAEAALAEFHRIVRPGGRLALIWNQRDRTHPFTEAYSLLVHEFASQHPAEERQGVADPIFATPWFRDAGQVSFPHGQSLSLEDLIGRARSTSYLPSSGELYERLLGRLAELHAQWRDDRGEVTLGYRTNVYRAARSED